MDDFVTTDFQFLFSARMGKLPPWGFLPIEASWGKIMILLVLVPFESLTGTLKTILLPIPQASLSPATIWLEAWSQDVGMCTGLHKNFS